MIRYVLYTVGFLIAALLLFFLLIVLPVDRTPVQEKDYYGVMMNRLDSLEHMKIPAASEDFSAGFAMESITPSYPVALAGYGNRRGRKFTEILDSIYVRAIVVDNGTRKVALVSADLLIIPPTVTVLLEQKLASTGFTLENTYLGATHTHNSIGNWGEGVTSLVYGSYSDSVVNFLADRIVAVIRKAAANPVRSKIKSGAIPVPSAVRNRLAKKEGTVDSLLHVVEIEREDEAKLVLVTYNAHATCLMSKDLALSGDYPGELVKNLEKNGYTFAMFMAGAVGSHGCSPPEYGRACIPWMGDEILQRFMEARHQLAPVADSALMMVRVPLETGEPQVKISADWRVRPWLFNAAVGEYQAYLTGLRMGNIVMLGTPADYSGELTAPLRRKGSEQNLHVIVTSFNGQYIGYITVDKYYDRSHYETRLMNWYGPGNGRYFTECLSEMVEILDGR